MTVSRRPVNGRDRWIIDCRFYSPNGEERYRRAAQVQTKKAAEAEERRLQNYFAQHGTIAPFLASGRPEPSKPVRAATWDDAVDYYKEHVLPGLEPSTQKGYRTALAGPHVAHWRGVDLGDISRAKIISWDSGMKKAGLTASTRRNQQVVLRAVLNAVGPHEDEPGVLMPTLPAFPKLPKVGRTEVAAVPDEDITALLGDRPKGFRFRTWSLFQLAVALAAYAGLRASEIRALRKRDVDLVNEIITVRLKRCAGQEGQPKSKHQRSIDFIAPQLLPLLKGRCEGLKPDDYVCPNSTGRPWSDNGLWNQFRRACTALGIEGQRVHGLRHAFATALFGGGVDARTVQDLLGHETLEVTMRYSHTVKERKRAAGRVFETGRAGT